MQHPKIWRALGLAIVVLSGLQLMVVLDGTVANLALARVQQELGLTDAGRNWILTSYALTFGGLMLLGGRLGDAYGRKRMFVLGVGLFTVSSLLCGLSIEPWMLIASRALQGVGAAIASPTALALVATTYPPGKVRNQAIAVFAAMTGIGSISGLIVGGALTQFDWRWIFLINVPIGFLIVGLALYALGETQAQRLTLDIPSAIFATLGCTSIVFGISEGPELGWSHPLVIGAGVLGAALLLVFLKVERSAENPLLPLSLFNNSDRVATFGAIFFAGAVMFSMAAYVALLVQDLLHYSPLRAGLAFLPFAVGLGSAAVVASKLAMRIAPRWLIMCGTLICFFGLLQAASHKSLDITYLGDMLLPILGIGFGVGLAVVPLPLCAVAGVGEREIGPLTAVTQVAQVLGGPLALAVIGAFATSKTLSLGGVNDGKTTAAEMTQAQLEALAHGYATALQGCAVFAALATFCALFIGYTAADVAQAQATQERAQSLD